MSLINEALKKAQHERPEMPMAPPPGGPVPPHPQQAHHGKRKPRGFLWGFLLALIIVGAVSSLLAAFLVLQLIDPKPEEKEEPASIAAQVPVRDDQDAEEVAIQTLEEAVPAETEAVPVAALPIETVPASEENAPPEDVAPAAAEPVAETVEQVVKETIEEKPVQVAEEIQEPAVPVAQKPDSEVIARLQQLEIRGIMSGATKALIHDLSTGRTKAYQEGESLEGSLGLSVVRISQNSLTFKDYAGHTHTKSF